MREFGQLLTGHVELRSQICYDFRLLLNNVVRLLQLALELLCLTRFLIEDRVQVLYLLHLLYQFILIIVPDLIQLRLALIMNLILSRTPWRELSGRATSEKDLWGYSGCFSIVLDDVLALVVLAGSAPYHILALIPLDNLSRNLRLRMLVWITIRIVNL